MNIIEWINNWYSSLCDGDWEHSYGIKIETLDNPGWIVKIDLAETDHQGKEFIGINTDHGDDDWIQCFIRDDQFIGAGDPTKLEKILLIFKEWIVSS